MSEPEEPEGVDRRSVLVGLGVALAAGAAGFAGFTAAGPTPGDDAGSDREENRNDDGVQPEDHEDVGIEPEDGEDDGAELEDREGDDRGNEDDRDRSGPNGGKG